MVHVTVKYINELKKGTGVTMKRTIKLVLSMLLVAALCLALLPYTEASAASKPKLNKTKLTLKQGEKKKLKVKKSGGKKIKWNSKKKRIATVSKKGLVTAKKVGKTTITAKVGKKTLRCKVTVVPRYTGTASPTRVPASTTPQVSKQTPAPTQPSTPAPTHTTTQPPTPAPTHTTTQSPTPAPTHTATQSPTPAPTHTATQSPTPAPTHTATQSPTPAPTTSPDELYDADTVSTSDYAKYYSTSAVHSGQATYFDGGYIDGCCNLDAIAGGFDVVAMNEYDYNKGLLAGAFIEITGPKGSVKALVTDLLPADESVRGNLDLNEKTFAKIADPIDGRVNVTWRVIALKTFDTISYRFKDESIQWWAQVQVVGHTYPIAKLEYESGGKYVELQRENYNFFTAPNGLGAGAVTFRVTDIFGHQLTDTGIVMSPGKTVPGKANFPE